MKATIWRTIRNDEVALYLYHNMSPFLHLHFFKWLVLITAAIPEKVGFIYIYIYRGIPSYEVIERQ